MFTYEVPLISFLGAKEKLAEPEGPSDAVAIGAGVGGTIAVLAVIAVVAFVVIKRRGKSFATVKRMIDMNGAITSKPSTVLLWWVDLIQMSNEIAVPCKITSFMFMGSGRTHDSWSKRLGLEFSSPESTFCAASYSGTRSTPVLLQ